MGNKQSTNTETIQNGKISEKHENGSANGLSAKITSNGLVVDVKSETAVLQNGESHSSYFATESSEYVIIESDCLPDSAQVTSEISDTITQKEEVKKHKEEKMSLFDKMFKRKPEPPAAVESVKEQGTSGEDQTDVSLHPTDPQQDSSGEEAATNIIVEHARGTAEISTQTDRRLKADISTQTGDDGDDDTTTEEHALNDSAEEVTEDTFNDELSDNQTSWIIRDEVDVTENDVYEITLFRVEQVMGTNGFWSWETKPSMTAKPESYLNQYFTDHVIASEENMTEQVLSFDLPKVVADCVAAVFAEYNACTTEIPSEPGEDEVITEDNSEEAGDVSADVVLIETTEPEPNAVTPETEEPNGIPSQDNEPVATVTETISEVVHEEPNPTPAYQDLPEEEPAVPLETGNLVKGEPAHDEVTADDAELLNPLTADKPSEDCDSCPEVACVTLFSELHGDALNSPDLEVESESTLEVLTTEETPKLGKDMIAEAEPEKVQRSQLSPAIVEANAEEIPEAAIDFLSQQLEHRATIPQEPATDNGGAVVEVITFVPLSTEQEASLSLLEEPTETVAEEINKEPIEALPKETETVPDSIEEDIAVQESSTEGERVISCEEPVKESEASEDTLVNAESPQTPEQTPVCSLEENPNPCEEPETTEMSENTVEAFLENLEVQESEPRVSVQEELTDGWIAPAEAPLEDADKETDAASVINKVLESVEATDSNSVILRRRTRKKRWQSSTQRKKIRNR